MAEPKGYILSQAEARDFRAMRRAWMQSGGVGATPTSERLREVPRDNTVKVRITSKISGSGGRYNGKMIAWGVLTSTPGTQIQHADLGDLSTYEDVLVWNLAEMVVDGHALNPSNDGECDYVGYLAAFDDATNKPIIFVNGRGGRGLIPVTLSQTGGSDGSSTTAASWTYTATEDDGTTTHTGMAPTHNRMKCKTMPATRGTLWHRASGTIELYQTDERPNFGTC